MMGPSPSGTGGTAMASPISGTSLIAKCVAGDVVMLPLSLLVLCALATWRRGRRGVVSSSCWFD
jgi:hypothetical protein